MGHPSKATLQKRHACEVSFRTQRVAAVSVVRFRIRLVTTVPAPRGALLIQGPEADALSQRAKTCHVT